MLVISCGILSNKFFLLGFGFLLSSCSSSIVEGFRIWDLNGVISFSNNKINIIIYTVYLVKFEL